MGTPCEIQLFATCAEQARRVFADVIADVQRLEAKYSRYRADSLLSAINHAAAEGGRIRVDEETAGLLDYADTCHAQSGGLFDISSGILRQAWNFRTSDLPEQRDIERLLQRIGWEKLSWHRPMLEFPLAGMELDFGGIVKEYAVDRAAEICRQAGIDGGLINLGGDLNVFGPRPGGQPWRIGIRHPRSRGETWKTLALQRGAVAGSGDYERCIEIAGVRYGHILNPRTGWPVKGLAAVTVVGEFCVVAGSAATIAMLKEGQGPEWLQILNLPHLWMDGDGNGGGDLA